MVTDTTLWFRLSNMRPGQIIDCPNCGLKHELLMARLETTTFPDGTTIRVNRALPDFLHYNCGGRVLIASLGGKSYLISKRPKWKQLATRLWNRIAELRHFWYNKP